MGITSLFKLLYLLFGRCGLFTAFSLYDFTQLAAVGSNQILFQRAGFELHHNIVVIGRNQTVTSFKVSDLHCFSIGQVQGFLYPLGFVVLQIQNDLVLELLMMPLPNLPPSRSKKSARSWLAKIEAPP